VKARSDNRAVEIVFEPVTAPDPWHAFRVKTSSYPLPAEERVRFAGVVDRLADAFSRRFSAYPTLWLDTQELHRDGGSKLFSQNSGKWSATMGFAFEPTGDPPRPVQMSDLLDVDYGTKVKVYDRSAIFVSNLTQTLPAYKVLAGRGLGAFLFFESDSGSGQKLAAAASAFMKRTQERLRPLMSPGAFQGFRFYLPLLSSAVMTRAGAQQLDAWLGDGTVYLREAFEEQEVFLLARYDCAAVFQDMGMRRLSAADDPVLWGLRIEAVPGG